MPGSSLTKPDEVVPCNLYEEPSVEEIAAYEAETDAMVSDSMKYVVPLIGKMKEKFGKTGGAETVTCPKCGGRLSMTCSFYNGHVWGKCATDKCLDWME